MSVKEVDEKTGEEVRRTFFREAAVFDVSQTEPLPDREPVPLSAPHAGEVEGDSHAELVPALEALAAEIGYRVTYSDELDERTLGIHKRKGRTIAVRADLAANRTVAVLIHELGHALVAESDTARLSAALEELIVESVAFVVSAGAGRDVSCEAVPYVAVYGGEDAAQSSSAAQVIDAIARRIEDALVDLRSDTSAKPG